MSNWTRAKDAWIARECEGLEVTWIEDWGPEGSEPHIPSTTRRDWMDRVAFYLTDPAAARRAAEAWRKMEPGRSYHADSAVDDAFGAKPESACCRKNYHLIVGSGKGAGALAQALYCATRGPA